MEIQVLKPEIKEALKTNKQLQLDLALANGNVSFWTIGQWRLNDNPILTTINNLHIIRTTLGLPEDAPLTEDKQPEEVM